MVLGSGSSLLSLTSSINIRKTSGRILRLYVITKIQKGLLSLVLSPGFLFLFLFFFKQSTLSKKYIKI